MFLKVLEKKSCLPGLSTSVLGPPLESHVAIPIAVPAGGLPLLDFQGPMWWVTWVHRLNFVPEPHLKQRLSISMFLSFLVMGPLFRIPATFERIQRDSCCSREPAPAPQHKLLWWEISVRPPLVDEEELGRCSEILKTCWEVARNNLC